MIITFLDSARFVAAVKAILTHASADETRPHLNCIHFHNNGTSVDAVTTDGHTMALYRFASDTFECTDSRGADSANISVEVATAFLKSYRKGTGTVILDTKAGTIAVGGASLAFDAKASESTPFPPYVQVLPDTTCVEFPLVSATYIGRAAKAFVSLTKRLSVDMSIVPSPDMGPITFRSASVPELVIVVMPMRGTVNRTPARALVADRNRLPGDASEPARLSSAAE
jgi:DNA polymerase III beta subunit, central domain